MDLLSNLEKRGWWKMSSFEREYEKFMSALDVRDVGRIQGFNDMFRRQEGLSTRAESKGPLEKLCDFLKEHGYESKIGRMGVSLVVVLPEGHTGSIILCSGGYEILYRNRENHQVGDDVTYCEDIEELLVKLKFFCDHEIHGRYIVPFEKKLDLIEFGDTRRIMVFQDMAQKMFRKGISMNEDMRNPLGKLKLFLEEHGYESIIGRKKVTLVVMLPEGHLGSIVRIYGKDEYEIKFRDSDLRSVGDEVDCEGMEELLFELKFFCDHGIHGRKHCVIGSLDVVGTREELDKWACKMRKLESTYIRKEKGVWIPKDRILRRL